MKGYETTRPWLWHSALTYEQEIRELENELNTEILPGTEVMADVGSHHFVKGKKNVLVPQPSDDQHDPLNWSTFWKAMCITASTSVSFTQGLGPLALAPMFPYYIKDFDSNLTDVSKHRLYNLRGRIADRDSFIGRQIHWCRDLSLGFQQLHLVRLQHTVSSRRVLTSLKGTIEYFIRTTTCVHLLSARVSSVLDMACKSANIQQFHGRLRSQRPRRWPGRDNPARSHCRYLLPSRPWLLEYSVLGLLHGQSYGGPNHQWINESARWVA